MKRLLALLCGLLLVTSERVLPPVQAQTADAELRQKVARLVDDLDAPSRITRTEAERDLLAIGSAVLPLLPAPDSVSGIARQESLRRIRVHLEQQAARESVRASRVSIPGKQSLADCVAAMSRQTGNVIAVDPELRDRQISLMADQIPFWQAISELEQLGYQSRFDVRAHALRLTQVSEESENSAAIRSTISEAFRVDVAPIAVRQIGDSKQWLLRCSVTLRSEPRLRPLILRYKLADQVLLDQRGRSIAPFNPSASLEVPIADGGRDVTVSLEFLSEEEPAGRFRLRTLFQLMTAAAEHPIVFQPLSRSAGVARRRGGVTVTVRAVEVDETGSGRNIRLPVRVSFDTNERAFESHQNWLLHNRVSVINATGTVLEPREMRTLRQDNGQVDLEYRFQNLAGTLDEWRFEYVAPTLLIDVPVSGEIANLSAAMEKREDK